MPSVYVFGEPGMLLVKIGKAQTPADRERSLQKHFAPDGYFLYEEQGLDFWAYSHAERRAHRYLKSRYWLQGEWFLCGAEIARRAVKHAARRAKKQRAIRRHENREWLNSPRYQANCRAVR